MNRIAVWAGCVCLLAVTMAAWAQAQPSRRYYSVTYTDGRVANLASLPDSSKGISAVVEVLRYESPDGGYVAHSTGRTAVTVVDGGQTVTRQFEWRQGRWQPAGTAEQTAADAEATSRPSRQAVVRQELARTRALRRAMADRVARLDHEIAAERRKLAADAAGQTGQADAATQPASPRLAKLELALEATLELEAKYAAEARTLAETLLDEPRGKVAPAADEPAKPGDDKRLGIVQPLPKPSQLEHPMQLWPLPAPTAGQRAYEVQMAHADAGLRGAFYYVVYADTDGDGSPDSLVARSPLAQADKPGQWSSWQFDSDQQSLFVGNVLPAGTQGYLQVDAPLDQKNFPGMSAEVWVGDLLGQLPRRLEKRAIGNIRVRPIVAKSSAAAPAGD